VQNQADIGKVKQDISKMVSMGAPESDIDEYIGAHGLTVDAIRDFKLDTPSTFASQQQARGAELADSAARGDNPASMMIRGTASGLRGVGDAIGSVTPDFVKFGASKVGEGVGALVNKSPLGQGVKTLYQVVEPIATDYLSKRPEMADNLKDSALIASTFIGGNDAIPQAKIGTELLSSGVENVGKSLIKSADKQASKNAFKTALKDTLELETPTIATERAVRKTNPKGILQRTEYNPTPRELEVAKQAADIGIDKKGTYQAKLNLVKKSIEGEAEKLKSNLEKSGVIFNRGELKNHLDGIAKQLESEPLLVGDAGETARRFIEKSKAIYNSQPSTPAGLLQARKDFDSLVEDQLGKAAFGSDGQTAVKVAVKAIRQGMNDFTAAKAPNIGVKESLKKQSLLYDAMDNLAPKAGKESSTNIGRGAEKLLGAETLKGKLVRGGALLTGTTALGAASMFAPVAAGTIGAGLAGYGLKKAVTSPKVKKAIGKTLEAAGKKREFIPKTGK
jgi:hypothetical protein